MKTVKISFIEGLWCAVNKLRGEIILRRKNRCDLMQGLVICGYARIQERKWKSRRKIENED